MLKYNTLDMSMGPSVPVTIDHVIELRKSCMDKNIATGLTEIDLIMVKFFDQNSDAAYKVFNTTIADLLNQHVYGSVETELYIRMVVHIMDPYRNVAFGSPPDVVQSIGTGLTMLRLWRKYLQLTKGRLTAQKGASSNPAKRGNFLTAQTYESLEIQSHAAIDHQLALFLHGGNNAANYASPKNASTVATERFIGQTQAKTAHYHSLNQEPSVADVVDRVSKIQHNINTIQKLAKYKVVAPSLSNRKKTTAQFVQHAATCDYSDPQSYTEFIVELSEAFRRGCDEGRFLMERLPKTFKETLVADGSWLQPYTYHYANVQLVSNIPTYNKISVRVNISGLEESSDEEKQPDSAESSELLSAYSAEKNANVCVNSEKHDDTADKGFRVIRNGKGITLSQAIKLAIGGKDYMSKDRTKKHRAPAFLPNMQPIPKGESVVRSSNYAVKVKGNAEVIHISSLEQHDGKSLTSTTLTSKARFRGTILDWDKISNAVSRPVSTRFTKWMPVKDIIGEIVLEEKDGINILTSESVSMLKEAGFIEYHAEEQETEENTLPDEYFEVKDIIDQRIDPSTHSTEYLVQFKGYGSNENLWVSSSTFFSPIAFTTKSRSGRIRKHTTSRDLEGKKPLMYISESPTFSYF